MASKGKICCGLIIIFIIIGAFLIFSQDNTAPKDEKLENFAAKGSVVAKNVDTHLDEVKEATPDKFNVAVESQYSYQGHWMDGSPEKRTYAYKFTVDLDDIEWDAIELDESKKADDILTVIEEYEGNSDLNKTLIADTFKNFMKSNFTKFQKSENDGLEGWELYDYHHLKLLKVKDNKLRFRDYVTYSHFSGENQTIRIDLVNHNDNIGYRLNIIVPMDSIEHFKEYDPYDVGSHENYVIEN